MYTSQSKLTSSAHQTFIRKPDEYKPAFIASIFGANRSSTPPITLKPNRRSPAPRGISTVSIDELSVEVLHEVVVEPCDVSGPDKGFKGASGTPPEIASGDSEDDVVRE